MVGSVFDRLDVNQTRTERARHHHERLRAADELLGEIGHATGPRDGPVLGVVDGDARRPGLLLCQRVGHDVEEPSGFRRIARGGANYARTGAHAGRQFGQRAGIRVELAPQLGLHTRQRLVVGRSESSALDGAARCGDGESDKESAGDETPGKRPHGRCFQHTIKS